MFGFSSLLWQYKVLYSCKYEISFVLIMREKSSLGNNLMSDIIMYISIIIYSLIGLQALAWVVIIRCLHKAGPPGVATLWLSLKFKLRCPFHGENVRSVFLFSASLTCKCVCLNKIPSFPPPQNLTLEIIRCSQSFHLSHNMHSFPWTVLNKCCVMN